MQQLPPPARGPRPSTITYIDRPRFTLREAIYMAIAASIVLVAAGLAFFFFAQGVDSLASAVDRLVTAVMRPIATLALSVMLIGAGIMFLLVGIAALRDSGSEPADQE